MGKLFGIRIRVDWSWLLIFVLTTWNLRTSLGAYHSDWGLALTWGVAVAASLLFFASVLLHELAHSLVAMARDVRQLPVMENGSLSGCLRRRDIVKWLQLHGEAF
jgi:Zn-dependent protease